MIESEQYRWSFRSQCLVEIYKIHNIRVYRSMPMYYGIYSVRIGRWILITRSYRQILLSYPSYRKAIGCPAQIREFPNADIPCGVRRGIPTRFPH